MTEDQKYTDFLRDLINYDEESNNNDLETSFIEDQCNFLVDQDVLQSFHVLQYDNQELNCRVDAWGLKPVIDSDSDLSLVLVLSDFHGEQELESQPLSSFRSYLEKGRRFFMACMKDSFRFDKLRYEAESVRSLADYIYENKEAIYDVTIIGITNTKITSRSNTLVISENSKNDYLFHYDVWDFCRYDKIHSSTLGRESVDIDFVNDYELSGGLKALTADTRSPGMSSYLFVLPGQVLYTMYEQWNERLLEQNPRTFLQFSTKVNKGLKNTLNKAPDRFFSYNNGITAVASGVDYDERTGTISSIKNFQIVNGGQTTASIFNCARSAKKKNELFFLDRVFVMVKMTVIEDPEKAMEIIPKISEYSNTQNKVSSSAFSIQHEYHKKMEEYSRKIWAPASSGQETHWYYERVQGQYKNAINLCRTPGEKKLFERQNPKAQMFKTVDLAKYVFAFNKRPDIVCKGAQKCYAEFCRDILKADKDSDEIQKYDGTLNEGLFKENCAKALIYKALEKRQGNGVRFVSVPYIIASVVKNLEKRGFVLNFDYVWRKQWDNNVFFDLLASYDEAVLECITSAMPQNTSLLSEWAKKPDCWRIVENLSLDVSPLKDYVISLNEYLDTQKDDKKEQKAMNEAEAQVYCFTKGYKYWAKLRDFVRENKIQCTPSGFQMLERASKPNTLISISGPYAVYLLRLEERAIKAGFDE